MRWGWLGLLVACGGAGEGTGDSDELTAPVPSIEPLRNGGAEDCMLGDWEPSDPEQIAAVEVQDQGSAAPPVLPWEGRCFFSLARTSAVDARPVLTQSGTANPGTVVTLTGFVYTSGFDSATFGFGGSAPTLREMQLSDEQWSAFSITHVVPPGDDAWVVELSGDLLTGSAANVYFDDLALVEREDVPPFRPSCGDGVVDPDEACDEGPSNGVGYCSETCDDLYGDACVLAETEACSAAGSPNGTDFLAGCFANPDSTPDGIGGRERAEQCTAVIACIRATRCTSDFANFEGCFCGSAPFEDCITHDPPEVVAALGPCVEEMVAAAGTPPEGTTVGSHASVIRQDERYPLGDAMRLEGCVAGDVAARSACW
ncbi:MAG: hypothetical protein AAF602_03725 [Myxococcota bacterium]